MIAAPPVRGGSLPAVLILSVLTITLAAADAPARGTSEPRPSRLSPSRQEWSLSMWAGLGSAESSDAATRQAGSVIGGTDDFGAFLLLGARLELFPSAASPAGKHFGFAIEIAGMAGEADVETQPGLPAEEVTLTAGVITPSLVFRFPGRTWEGYAGAGPTVIWGSRISGVGSVFFEDDDTDLEVPLGLALYAGARRTSPRGWFFMLEARHQRGQNNFDLRAPRTEILIDWRMTQLVIGSGYRF